MLSLNTLFNVIVLYAILDTHLPSTAIDFLAPRIYLYTLRIRSVAIFAHIPRVVAYTSQINIE